MKPTRSTKPGLLLLFRRSAGVILPLLLFGCARWDNLSLREGTVPGPVRVETVSGESHQFEVAAIEGDSLLGITYEGADTVRLPVREVRSAQHRVRNLAGTVILVSAAAAVFVVWRVVRSLPRT